MMVKVNKRNLDTIDNNQLDYYQKLKDKLVNNFKKEIFHKIEVIKILKEIKDNEYYKLDGYNSFNSFAKNYKIARTQVYDYLRLANAMEEGLLEERFIIENGLTISLLSLRDKEGVNIKKSRQNPIKPLRFQLKSQNSYAFYKSNAKFTSFLMDELFENQKDLLDKLLKKYKELKGE
ncbi:Plasmid partition family protein (plasmid) [Borrelia hermsii YBT]|uniref:Plasmid partition family protein n=1 Tax=Borrelia hermsii YBT TaxID=1313295 RepID=W5T1X7_BORHE|nr:chromosome replication/partitioning protein [Borrelia hermsii]AHH13207.1 Plasmid partition family protein [Borrelia hermsii YBT]